MNTTGLTNHPAAIATDGFTTVANVFSAEEVETLLSAIDKADQTNANFRKAEGLFAIRQFFKEIPEAVAAVFNLKFRELIEELLGDSFFVVKSIYFDKQEGSNWFVAWHQDLMISVDQKHEFLGFGPWTNKQGQYAVQPPVDILEGNFTLRIHLDDTDHNNGALRVITGAHQNGIYRPETIDWTTASETICNVSAGGVMIMKPLLMHSSGRSVSDRKRRVIHIEFSNRSLPAGLNWAEKMTIPL